MIGRLFQRGNLRQRLEADACKGIEGCRRGGGCCWLLGRNGFSCVKFGLRHRKEKMVVILAPKLFPAVTCSRTRKGMSKPDNECKVQTQVPALSSRRHILVQSASFVTLLTLSCTAMPPRVWAEVDKASDKEEKDGGMAGAIKSLFDPNEKTKSGKVLPKAYLKSAREVVKTLRESLKEDPKDIAKFRRTADAAKDSIREYLSSWRGQEKVVREESYVELEKAIRSLASFYSKAGPSAPLPEEVKSEILNDLSTAEEFL